MSNNSSLGFEWVGIAFAGAMLGLFVWMCALGLIKIFALRREAKELAARPPGHFVFAKIFDPILPMDRSAKYEKPLGNALRTRGLGYVTGGGTQMKRDRSTVDWVGIDLELANLDDALVFVRDHFKDLGAPAGSLLEYRVGDERKVLPIV